MIKRICFFLLLTFVAKTAFTHEDAIDLASLDKDISAPLKKNATTPRVTERYEYYEVGGCREDELVCDIKKKCVKWNDGKKYDAVTTWNVNWEYGYDQAPQACAADSFRVAIEILFRYPKWARTDKAPIELVDKWDRYMQNLVVHENGHRDIAVKAAAKLSRAVAALPAAPTCDELDRRVKALTREQLQELNEEQREYDERTNHGVTQGALFP